MPPRNDPRVPKPEIQWVKKVPRKRTRTREELLVLAREMARHPGKWALIRAYAPTDPGYKAADQRANEYRRTSSAFSKVGKFQFSVRFDPGYTGDYHGKPEGETTERGGWLLIGRCRWVHKLDEKHPTEYEPAFEFTTNPEEVVSRGETESEAGEGSLEEGDL